MKLVFFAFAVFLVNFTFASTDMRTACGVVQYVYTQPTSDDLQIKLKGINGETRFSDGLAYIFFIGKNTTSRDYVISAINSSLFLNKPICIEAHTQTVQSLRVFKK